MPRKHQFPFELRHLVYFHEVARLLHFRKAADSLVITQPALSRQIRQLEESLGTKLLERHSRRVELTAEGLLLAQKCSQLFPQIHSVVDEMRARAQGGEGAVRVMFSSLALASVVPKVLRKFSSANPRAQIELTCACTEQQLRALRSGEADIGFCNPETLPAGFSSLTLAEEPMGIVLPRRHGLARQDVIAPGDLGHENFIFFIETENALLYQRMLKFWRGHGFEPRVRQNLATREHRVALVSAGLGVTYGCPSEAASLPDDVVFRPLTKGNFIIKTTAVWRSGKVSAILKRIVAAL